MIGPRFTYLGMNVHAAASWPKMRLSKAVTVSDEFRAQMDAWLEAFFGRDCILEPGKVIQFSDAIIMHPADIERLRYQFEERFNPSLLDRLRATGA